MWATLAASQGMPMIAHGDEIKYLIIVFRIIPWMDWSLVDKNADLHAGDEARTIRCFSLRRRF